MGAKHATAANAAEHSFKIADRRINALLEKLKRQDLCGCCVARALLLNGAALMEDTAGSDEAVATCERIIGHLRESNLPAPLDLSGTRH